jgi:hypothetical protein
MAIWYIFPRFGSKKNLATLNFEPVSFIVHPFALCRGLKKERLSETKYMVFLNKCTSIPRKGCPPLHISCTTEQNTTSFNHIKVQRHTWNSALVPHIVYMFVAMHVCRYFNPAEPSYTKVYPTYIHICKRLEKSQGWGFESIIKHPSIWSMKGAILKNEIAYLKKLFRVWLDILISPYICVDCNE